MPPGLPGLFQKDSALRDSPTELQIQPRLTHTRLSVVSAEADAAVSNLAELHNAGTGTTFGKVSRTDSRI